jgi:hypothetical protein
MKSTLAESRSALSTAFSAVLDLLRILIIAVIGVAAGLGALFLLDALLPLHPKGVVMPTIFVGSAIAGGMVAMWLLRTWPTCSARLPRQESSEALNASSEGHV